MYRNRNYPSKILLTGEYTVLLGYPAIAIPWSGRFAHWNDTGATIDVTLQKFYNFIKAHPQLKSEFSLEEFGIFIQGGGYLESNIPFGYGLGSSGSFCAAVFDKFSSADKNDFELVFTILKETEHFFHGQSSGLDPVVSYFNRPVQVCKAAVTFPQIASNDINHFNQSDALYRFSSPEFMRRLNLRLVDTAIQRNTRLLVSGFNESIKNSSYLSKLQQEIIPLNEKLIQSLVPIDVLTFDKIWKLLSIASMEVFQKMIPETFNPFWEHGIESNNYYCKLCGAGGGGLFLVKVIDDEDFNRQLKNFGYQIFT